MATKDEAHASKVYALQQNGGPSEPTDTQKKREYNRRFMRRWRSDPAHQALERERRRQRYCLGPNSQRLHRSGAEVPPPKGIKKCRLCSRPAAKEVTRLEAVGGRYVEMRIPYCGIC
jgi:hypothetical protein